MFVYGKDIIGVLVKYYIVCRRYRYSGILLYVCADGNVYYIKYTLNIVCID